MSTATVTSGLSDREAFTTRDWSLFVAIGLIWGASFLLIALGLRSFHPGLITWARVGSGALALVLIPSSRKRIDRSDRGRLLILSVVWVGIPFTLFPLAETHINSAVTGLLNGATPFFAALIGGLFFARRPRGPQLLGLATGSVGIAMISLSSGAEGETAAWGVLMVLGATLCYGVATNLAGPLQKRYGSMTVMAQMLVLATIWTAPFGVYGLVRSDFQLVPALATLVLGVVGTGFAFALMAELVGSVGGPRASTITYLIPVVSMVLGMAFLRDKITGWSGVGVGVVLLSALLTGRREG